MKATMMVSFIFCVSAGLCDEPGNNEQIEGRTMGKADIAGAVRFVSNRGTGLQIRLAQFAVGETDARAVEELLADYQNDGGGWRSLDGSGRFPLSTISFTQVALEWLAHLQPEKETLIDRTMVFLSRTQRPDGSWDESEDILTFDPPPWMHPGVHANRVWLTVAILARVQALGRTEEIRFRDALDFVKAAWTDDGFPAYPHTHWVALELLSGLDERDEQDDLIMRGCVDYLTDAIERDTIDTNDLTSVIQAATAAGASSLERMAMVRFNEGQAADGGWNTEYGDALRPAATVKALLFLRRSRTPGFLL